MSDLIKQGLEFTVVGLSIVFAVLILIAWFVAWIRKVDTFLSKREERGSAKAESGPPNLDELTMVLIAAAAMTLLQGRARIRSIRRVQNNGFARSSWSLQGRASLQGMHVISKKVNHF
ncbi:MAG: OadG family protein [Planctomycetota bacterium]